MTEFWKSNAMHWCDYCKCWLKARESRESRLRDARERPCRAAATGPSPRPQTPLPPPHQDTPVSRAHHEGGLRHKTAVDDHLRKAKRAAADAIATKAAAEKGMAALDARARAAFAEDQR